jgi:hypothetical protein
MGKLLFQLTQLADWCGRILQHSLQPVRGPIHVMFCMADHYEPGTGGLAANEEQARVAELVSAYPKLVDGHHDHDGRIPGRTWFFPPHYHRYGNLRALVALCERGYGEVELHLHHGKTQPDTEANLRATLLQTIAEYQQFGIFGTDNNQRRRYGFIHGDWALDNSRHNQYCGVNSELSVLRETGCYADFTFPSSDVPHANPKRIFFADDDPQRPRSHATGREARVGGGTEGDLLLVTGPVHPYFLSGRRLGLRMIGDAVTNDAVGIDSRRIDQWVRTAIHVAGRRNWVFIKTHTHGATGAPVVLGPPLDAAFTYLESKYNDGDRYILHYVTTREMYNIIRAAIAGESGENPNLYRDYVVKAPRYDASLGITEASPKLQALVNQTYA